jgi:indolepyruvate ferredoxin oxidoreductase beta subunit
MFEISPRQRTTSRPITIAITAIGGQGGGVLADWIVSLAGANGYIAQYTSIAGVAQRTGATIYYLELFPSDAVQAKGREPIMALMPQVGDVDVVLAAELMEAGRAVVRGLVSNRTTLIASTHRIYGITEKTAMGDGAVDPKPVIEAGRKRAKRVVLFDMAEVAERNGSVISAALFGALAGSGVLPFAPEAYEAAVREGGVGVAASLATFREAHGFAMTDATPAPVAPASQPKPALSAAGQRMVQDMQAVFPENLWPVIREGLHRLADYQDRAYAADYLERLALVLLADQAAGGEARRFRLTDETGRALALWMSYEDTIRVADLKTRRSRFSRVRDEVKAGDDELVYTSEFMHPRFEEFCDTLPAPLGRRLSGQAWLRRILDPLFKDGRRVATGKLRGFALLYLVAALRPMRPTTLRHEREMSHLCDWLDRIIAAAASDYELAVEIALCQGLVKGYGDTHARGMRSFAAIMRELDACGGAAPAARVAALRSAALADESGKALQAQLAASAA